MGFRNDWPQNTTGVQQDLADLPAAPRPAQCTAQGTHSTQGPNNLRTTTSDL